MWKMAPSPEAQLLFKNGEKDKYINKNAKNKSSQCYNKEAPPFQVRHTEPKKYNT